MSPMRRTEAAEGGGVAAASQVAKRASYNNIRAFQQRAEAQRRPRVDRAGTTRQLHNQ